MNEKNRILSTNIPGENFCVEERELNPHADPRFANNGGGYHQPQFIVTSNRHPNWVLILENTSCGDFGTRYSAELKLCDETVATAYWGSMDGGKISTEFTARWQDWCRAAKQLGFNIPTTWGKDYISQEYYRYHPRKERGEAR